ncbi:MAG: TonB-dependent siderophore receptor [Gammaproteobacteria bacterium]
MSTLVLPEPAFSQAPAGRVELEKAFRIPAGDLTTALRTFADVSGLQLVYATELTASARTSGVTGSMSESAALAKLLTGTGLTYRFAGERTVTIERDKSAATRTLGPVRVEGENTAATTAGANGSTDPTATEGTKSYTSGALSIASKMPQSIKDTAQSVSVITAQRMKDQNITDFTSLMNQATGVSVVTTSNGPLAPTFYSRGFAISRMQVDGGAPMDIGSGSSITGLVTQLDMGMYDHAEVLRGSDGLFNGYGDPGGVINLVRKRPLDHAQATIEGQYGSWDNSRTTLDATGPLGLDGRLRGRAVIAYQNQGYFYDIAGSNKTLAYGALEGDLTSSTTLMVGLDVTRQNAVPFVYGLPRYQSGGDLKLPRDTCLCFPWNRYDIDTKEGFATLEQSLNSNWSLKINVTHLKQASSYKEGYANGTVNPATLAGPLLNAQMQDRGSEQTAMDSTLNGSFELFGHRQVLVVGANYAKVDGGGYTSYTSPITNTYVSPTTGLTGYPPVNVFGFDPGAYPEPPSGLRSGDTPQSGTTQWSGYATLRLTLWDPLHLIAGLRYSHYRYGYISDTLCTKIGGCALRTGGSAPVGGVTGTTVSDHSTHDFSWPPTVELVYDLNKTLSLYGSYTDIYREISTDVDRSGNPLRPITGGNVEGGIKWSPRGGRLNASLSLYHLVQKDFPLFLDYGDYASTGGAVGDHIHNCCFTQDPNRLNVSEGADLDVTGEILPGLQFSAGYTYNLNKRDGSFWGTSEGQPLVTLSPKHLLKLWASEQFPVGGWLGRASVGAGVVAQSKSYTSGTACTLFDFGTDPSGRQTAVCHPGANVPFNFSQGFYSVFSARAAYQLDSRWNLALNVDNLLDRTYYQTAGTSTSGNWYGDPRTFMLSVRGSF